MIFNKLKVFLRYIHSFIIKFFIKKTGKSFFPGFFIEVKGGNNISIGSNFSTESHVKLFADEGVLKIGNHVRINNNVFIGASSGKIFIGNNVLIGPNTVIRSSNHNFKKNSLINSQKHLSGEIIIEDDVWIGANVVILPNTKIKKGAVIGAGSIVTKSVDNYVVVAGNPAKQINLRK